MLKAVKLDIATVPTTARTIRVEIDRDHFERLAGVLGLYHPDFLTSLDRAESDVKAGRVKKLTSLADLRSNARR